MNVRGRRSVATEPKSPWDVAPANASPPGLGDAEVGPSEEPVPATVLAHAPRRDNAAFPTTGELAPSPQPFVWVSAHGGAGATSLALSTTVGLDLVRQWPNPVLGWPSTVAVVCRSNTAGLDAAAELLADAASGAVPDLDVRALVVVADAPTKVSREIRSRIRELSGTVPLLLQVEWISQWRDAPYTPCRAASQAADLIRTSITQEKS